MIEKKGLLSPKILIAIPLAVYLISYAYLTYYHQSFWLFNIVIHEGGTLTFLETLLYASHFLGHIPVHVVLAFTLTGSYLCLTASTSRRNGPLESQSLLVALTAFLLVSILLSFTLFGSEDTLSFILQRKQGTQTYETGGSWNLHLPSTLLLSGFLPCFVFALKRIFCKDIEFNRQGLPLIGIGLTLTLVMTGWLNKGLAPLWELWNNPRYMAHSVREIATFPLTYFPLPLYFLFTKECGRQKLEDCKVKLLPKEIKVLLAVLFLLFASGCLYQVLMSLSHGVEEMAHKPAFAKEGTLSIFYLLASHYFEHFLDTIFFTLVCLLIVNRARNERTQKIVCDFGRSEI